MVTFWRVLLQLDLDGNLAHSHARSRVLTVAIEATSFVVAPQ